MKTPSSLRRRIRQLLSGTWSGNRSLYQAHYTFREGPLPRPISNISLGEAFGWFFSDQGFLPADPHVNEVARRCRTDPSYSGDRPQRVTWSAERETGHALYSVLRLLRPQNVAEIGIYNGASSLCIAQALHDNNDAGHLHCVEVDDYNIALTHHHLREAGLAELASFYHGSSHDSALVAQLPSCEFVFVDGDHSYEGARSDFELFRGKLSPRGMMLYHDTIKIMALRQLMQEISESGDFDVFTVATSDGDGITFLRSRQ